MSITRRLFLRNTAAGAAAAATVTTSADAAKQVAVELSIDELIDHHQAGLKAALERKFGEKGWRMWAVGPRGVKGPSVFFNEDETVFLSDDPEKGGAK
jgi:hypothetical protein